MDEQEVSDLLISLTDKQLVEFFYKHLRDRHLYPGEEAHLACHLILGAARRDFDDGRWSPWRVELLCPTPAENWNDDAPVAQFGEHCGHHTASWAKHSECPVCGGKVFGT